MKLSQKTILPQGFKAFGVSAGIKKSGKPDLALFFSDTPAKAACLFTSNKIQAAPLRVSKDHLKKSKSFQAIIANSGNANCFTGKIGVRDAKATAAALAKELGIKTESILVSSTGIIGKRLQVDKIKSALPLLVKGLSGAGIEQAKKAIMTTDTFPKTITVKSNIGGKTVVITGVAKGVGMIAPNLATMLVFIFTDAKISQGALKSSLKQAAEKTFNCISVDGCMSTNDTVAILANGKAGNNLINTGKNLAFFSRGLEAVSLELAKLLVKDGEGARKFIRIKVSGAKNFSQAKIAALAVANSNLFKTAVYGENPNFGRIVAAVGASGIDVEEKNLKVHLSSLKKKDIFVDIVLHQGNSSATVYTCDLTPEYIRINAEYN
ncbi:MAG: bifunctional glutamate N-acetyltransferase/amino-acid acetyltransferase ArgJ [Candidatus Omnitrophica bacterium]|nr:bifunctional glutamate N-acetyltransferase/amino-acid acetyltransferase ArgJ [Candidatus Omnitrophota bacterium]